MIASTAYFYYVDKKWSANDLNALPGLKLEETAGIKDDVNKNA